MFGQNAGFQDDEPLKKHLRQNSSFAHFCSKKAMLKHACMRLIMTTCIAQTLQDMRSIPQDIMSLVLCGCECVHVKAPVLRQDKVGRGEARAPRTAALRMAVEGAGGR